MPKSGCKKCKNGRHHPGVKARESAGEKLLMDPFDELVDRLEHPTCPDCGADRSLTGGELHIAERERDAHAVKKKKKP